MQGGVCPRAGEFFDECGIHGMMGDGNFALEVAEGGDFGFHGADGGGAAACGGL